MLTVGAMWKIRYWTSLHVEVRLLQARAHSSSTAVPRVSCATPLAAHLKVPSPAGADNTLQCLFSDAPTLGFWGYTRQMCKEEEKISLSAFLRFVHLSNAGLLCFCLSWEGLDTKHPSKRPPSGQRQKQSYHTLLVFLFLLYYLGFAFSFKNQFLPLSLCTDC